MNTTLNAIDNATIIANVSKIQTPVAPIQTLQLVGLYLLYFLFIIILLLYIIFMTINYYRIMDKKIINPDFIALLLPFILNYIMSKTIFYPLNPFITVVPCFLIVFLGWKLKNLRLIGLTGGIATGKSTFVKSLRQNIQIDVIDCDKINQNLRQKGKGGYNLILKMLGDKKDQFLSPINKQIDRQKLSNYAFQNPKFLKKLTAQMGKLIIWQIFKDIISLMIKKKHIILVDAPILFQSKILEWFLYPIIVIGCDEKTQLKRLMQRNKFTQQQAQDRIKSQMPLSLKKKKCDIFVKNQGEIEDMIKYALPRLNAYIAKHPTKEQKNMRSKKP